MITIPDFSSGRTLRKSRFNSVSHDATWQKTYDVDFTRHSSMREKPTKDPREQLFKCGTMVTVVGKGGSYTIHYYCKRWDHAPCKKYKIKKLKERIACFAGIFVYVGTVPDEKRWIEKNIKKNYICIQFDKHKIIISEAKFQGCTTHEKRTFVEKLSELLDPLTEGRRISGRRQKKALVKTENEYLAMVSGDRLRELQGKNDLELAIWLFNEQDKVLYNNGRLFLKYYKKMRDAHM
ncbi:MAG: hypothetical protein AB2L22_17895 [Syntrophales bacterium]